MITLRRLLGLGLLACLLAPRAGAVPLELSYGGRLTGPDGAPLEGTVDLYVSFFHSATGADRIAIPELELKGVALQSGVFQISLTLDAATLHSVFADDAAPVWIEIARGAERVKYPRQKFSAVPYALKVPIDTATLEYDADGKLTFATGVLSHDHTLTGDVTGTANGGTTVTKLQGNPVASVPPANGEFLKWNQTNGRWEPGGVAGASGGTVTDVTAGTGLTGGTVVTSGTIAVDVGTSAGKIPQLDGAGKLQVSTIPALAGDVTGTQGATVVSQVGGVTAANVASGANAANGATSANTASKLVARDASGNFAAGTITANLAGNATTATTAASFTGSLSGDVTGTQAATVVANVGGVTAANVATGANAANGATSANTASKLVARDASGNFTAGRATLDTSVRLKDNDGTANYLELKAPANVAGDVSYVLPAAPDAGKFLTVDASGNLSWASVASSSGFSGSLSGDVTGTQGATAVASVGGVTAANVASGATAANNAASANTASAIVKRDASGNFTAGTITANLSGNATTATTATSFSGSLTGDVSGTQGATTVDKLKGRAVSAAAPTANQVLKWNDTTTTWEPAADANAGGTVTSVVAGTGLTGGTITGSGTIAVDVGTGASKIPQLDGSGKLATSTIPSFAGDVTGTVGATSVTKLQGRAVASTAPTGGQVLKWNSSTTQWEPGLDLPGGAYDMHASAPGSSVYVDNTGAVGIGTTSPATALHVSKATNAILRLTGSATAYNGIQMGATNGYYVGTDGNGDFVVNRDAPLGTGSLTAMKVTTTGNVGLGTNPTGPGGYNAILKVLRTNNNYGLLVEGDTGMQSDILLNTPASTTGRRLFQFVNTSGKLLLRGLSDDASTVTYSFLTADAATGFVGFNATTPANKVQIGSVGTSGYASNDLAIGNGTQVLAIDATVNGAEFFTNKNFVFTASGVGATGNVGIGTASPSERLDLGGGNIAMGYETVINHCTNTYVCFATCPAGKQIISGGCVSTSYATGFGGNTKSCAYGSFGGDCDTSWMCVTTGTTVVSALRAVATCANIK